MTTAPEDAQTTRLVSLFRAGRLRDANLVCRNLIARYPFSPLYHSALGDIALKLRRPDVAITAYSAALRIDPSFAAARQGLLSAQQADAWVKHNRPEQKQRYFLIKPWIAGFWSEVDHVLGGLLAAEMTGRTPAIAWGTESHFTPDDVANGWELYFRPVSAVAFDKLRGPGMNYFPGKWTAANLSADVLQKWSGPDSRMSALYFFNRTEDVVVSDFFHNIPELMPWIEPSSPLYGASSPSLYRMMMQRYVHLQPHLAQAIEEFWQKQMAGRHWLAVHMRGTDKHIETPGLDAINDSYPGVIDSLLARQPDTRIFLLTDSQTILARMTAIYGARLLATESIRGSGSIGVHLAQSPKEIVGQQVIIDTYLAARCDYFLGNGTSNVSRAVDFLKAWAPDRYHLLGPDLRGMPFFLREGG